MSHKQAKRNNKHRMFHVYCNFNSTMFFSPWETQGKISVGKDWRRDHGCTSARMIVVQRGVKCFTCIVIVKEAALTSAICHFHIEGGCWALLSQVPAARSWSSSVCCGQREPWQRTRLLQEILLWESVCGSEGLFLRVSCETRTLKKL